MKMLRASWALLLLTGCGDGGTTSCTVDGDCASGERCRDARCVAVLTDAGDRDAGASDAGARDAGARDGGVDASTPIDAGPPGDAGCVDPTPPADRPTAVACSACRPTGTEPGGGSGACAAHTDCTAGTNGRCVLGQIGAFCSYDDCFTDADCADDEVCSCDGSAFGASNICVPSNCRVNADCTSGVCAPSYGCIEGGAPEGWYCRTSSDTCATEEDCDPSQPGRRCAFDTTLGHWQCEYLICVF